MEDYNRARQYGDGSMQMESYYGPPPPRPATTYDLRSYSSSYPQTQLGRNRDLKLKKGKSASGSSSKSWAFGDPEFQRKKRVASYKMYSVEGKMKGSLRRSFRWLKDKYTQVLYGWWWFCLYSHCLLSSCMLKVLFHIFKFCCHQQNFLNLWVCDYKFISRFGQLTDNGLLEVEELLSWLKFICVTVNAGVNKSFLCLLRLPDIDEHWATFLDPWVSQFWHLYKIYFRRKGGCFHLLVDNKYFLWAPFF